MVNNSANINTKRNITSPLKSFHIKQIPQHMTLDIHILAWDRHKKGDINHNPLPSYCTYVLLYSLSNHGLLRLKICDAKKKKGCQSYQETRYKCPLGLFELN